LIFGFSDCGIPFIDVVDFVFSIEFYLAFPGANHDENQLSDNTNISELDPACLRSGAISANCASAA
jgi:hypothetical protein